MLHSSTSAAHKLFSLYLLLDGAAPLERRTFGIEQVLFWVKMLSDFLSSLAFSIVRVCRRPDVFIGRPINFAGFGCVTVCLLVFIRLLTLWPNEIGDTFVFFLMKPVCLLILLLIILFWCPLFFSD